MTASQDIYPTREEDVTADQIARHLTRVANERHKRIEELIPAVMRKKPGDPKSPEDRIYIAETSAYIAEFAVAYLLRMLSDKRADVPPGLADLLATHVWNAWEDGGTIGELLYEWAAEYGQLDSEGGPNHGN